MIRTFASVANCEKTTAKTFDSLVHHGSQTVCPIKMFYAIRYKTNDADFD